MPNVKRYDGRPFRTERKVTQGDPISPTVFYIAVDTHIRTLLMEVCGLQES